jgi:hypothetical protein
MIYPKGKLVISAGGGQAGVKLATAGNVVEGTIEVE